MSAPQHLTPSQQHYLSQQLLYPSAATTLAQQQRAIDSGYFPPPPLPSPQLQAQQGHYQPPRGSGRALPRRHSSAVVDPHHAGGQHAQGGVNPLNNALHASSPAAKRAVAAAMMMEASAIWEEAANEMVYGSNNPALYEEEGSPNSSRSASPVRVQAYAKTQAMAAARFRSTPSMNSTIQHQQQQQQAQYHLNLQHQMAALGSTSSPIPPPANPFPYSTLPDNRPGPPRPMPPRRRAMSTDAALTSLPPSSSAPDATTLALQHLAAATAAAHHRHALAELAGSSPAPKPQLLRPAPSPNPPRPPPLLTQHVPSQMSAGGPLSAPVGGPMSAPVGMSPLDGPGTSNGGRRVDREQKKLNLYKTELCRSFEETGVCRYGGKCQFAHSRSELRVVDRHPKYKTQMCKTFWEKGTCPYGKRCCFIHTSHPSMAANSSTSSTPSSNANTPTLDSEDPLLFGDPDVYFNSQEYLSLSSPSSSTSATAPVSGGLGSPYTSNASAARRASDTDVIGGMPFGGAAGQGYLRTVPEEFEDRASHFFSGGNGNGGGSRLSPTSMGRAGAVLPSPPSSIGDG
ncbi:hypothetical protein HK101_003683, partial [Irineochytrium annulatum]